MPVLLGTLILTFSQDPDVTYKIWETSVGASAYVEDVANSVTYDTPGQYPLCESFEDWADTERVVGTILLPPGVISPHSDVCSKFDTYTGYTFP